jgi:hypothetical protein
MQLQPMITANQADELMIITAVYDRRAQEIQPAGGCVQARKESGGVTTVIRGDAKRNLRDPWVWYSDIRNDSRWLNPASR